MKLLTAEEMREIDARAMSDYGIPGVVLMENAAIRTVEMISELLPRVEGSRVIVLAGKGNNGGDGLAIARHLNSMGSAVQVYMLCEPVELKGDAAINYEIASKISLDIKSLTREEHLDNLLLSILQSDLIVDAIYGTGFKGEMPPLESQVARMLNWSNLPIVSVDIPSGVEANTGRVRGEAVRATCTVTFALPKIGLILEPGKTYAGTVSVADITIPRDLMESPSLKTHLITENMVKKLIKPREVESHKGTYGHVLAMGGSRGMTGAIRMTALSALRAGAGLVTAAVPESLCDSINQAMLEVMVTPLRESSNAAIGLEALPAVENLLDTMSVCIIGPGMSRYSEAFAVVKRVLEKSGVPVVIDADALNALSDQAQVLANRQIPIVITPHPGEMARLTGLTVSDVQARRLEIAREYAGKWGITVVLKGNKTIVACPDGELYVNVNGNPGMATGGTGDVLAGIIGGLVAQGLKVQEASVAGVFIQGLAGDYAAQALGMNSMIAGDIIQFLPEVFKQLEKQA